MYSFILFLHVIFCLILLALVLIQRSKSGDIGASFGAGASATVFGAAGSTSFLVKLTTAFALLFFITSLTLGAMSAHVTKTESATDTMLAAAKQSHAAAQTLKLPNGPMPVSEN
jgi:preprotein translocase subunit SecG